MANKAVEILEKQLEEIRKVSRELAAEIGEKDPYDPVTDVIVESRDEGHCHAVLKYDGAGYEYFSYQSRHGRSRREKLRAALEKHDMYFEDRNNWSLAVYDI